MTLHDLIKTRLEQKLPKEVAKEYLSHLVGTQRNLPFCGSDVYVGPLLTYLDIWHKRVTPEDLDYANDIQDGKSFFKLKRYRYNYLIFINETPLTLEEMQTIANKKYKMVPLDDLKVKYL